MNHATTPNARGWVITICGHRLLENDVADLRANVQGKWADFDIIIGRWTGGGAAGHAYGQFVLGWLWWNFPIVQ